MAPRGRVPPDEYVSYVPTNPDDLDGNPPTYEGEDVPGAHMAADDLAEKAQRRAKLPDEPDD